MDTNSVRAAFSTVPAVSGSFVWSAARYILTFTPVTNWPGLTLVTARLAEAAQDMASNHLHGAFETRFRTASAAVVRPTITISADGSDVRVNCDAVYNRNYQLQRRGDLILATAWENVGPIVLGSNHLVTLLHVGGRSNASSYYRVLVQ